MPIYEYRCLACRRRTSLFVRSASTRVRPKCEHCGSVKLSRLMSKFAVHRSGGGGDDFDDDLSGMEDVDENDPASVARWARRMQQETGEDLGPEFEEMVGRMEAGEDPDAFMGDGEGDGFGGADDDF
jgi:putative FmdB family regulatory protein